MELKVICQGTFDGDMGHSRLVRKKAYESPPSEEHIKVSWSALVEMSRSSCTPTRLYIYYIGVPFITMSNMTCPLQQNPSYYNCNNPYPVCHSPAGFDFSTLSIISSCIAACANDSRLFDGVSITQAACEAIVGSDDFTAYPAADIWARLTTWKFPLFQLVAIFPRPPLSLAAEAFVLVHLLGDPIGTLTSLLLKVASCQSRANYWKEKLQGDLSELLEEDVAGARYTWHDRIWKRLANIVDSYDEWGQDIGNEAREALYTALSPENGRSLEERRHFLDRCQLTAKALAADRATKFLPIVVAQSFFIGTIGMAFGRTPTASSGSTPQTFINIETHSIAFSALYFWILPAVFLGSVMGVSQTEEAIPRILERFRAEISRDFADWNIQLPNEHFSDRQRREFSGGLYSWLPRTVSRSSAPRHTRSAYMAVALLVWGLCTFTAVFISYRVPPLGFGCRSIAELSLATIWLFSAALNYIPFADPQRAFRFAFFKDFVSMGLTLSGIVATQVGVMNRCSCYTQLGTTGLALPEITSVANFLFRGIAVEYPLEAFACIAVQLVVVPAAITFAYRTAMRVFLQRDDDLSNRKWWHAVRDFFERHLPIHVGRQRRRSVRALSNPRGALHRFFRRAGRIATGQEYVGTEERAFTMPLDVIVGGGPDRQGDADGEVGRQASVSSAEGLIQAQREDVPFGRAKPGFTDGDDGDARHSGGASSSREPGETLRMRGVRSF